MPLQTGHVDDDWGLMDLFMYNDLRVGPPPRLFGLHIFPAAPGVTDGDCNSLFVPPANNIIETGGLAFRPHEVRARGVKDLDPARPCLPQETRHEEDHLGISGDGEGLGGDKIWLYEGLIPIPNEGFEATEGL